MVLLAGMLLAGGVVALVVAFQPAAPELRAALQRMSTLEPAAVSEQLTLLPGSRSDRLGAYVYRHSFIALGAKQRLALKLQNKRVAEFYGDKAVMAMVGAVVPATMAFCFGYLTGSLTVLPALVGLLGAVAGFFIPDLILVRRGTRAHTGAEEALLVFIDLVTLERLANASATQALQNAARLSDAPLFTHIRAALDRAQLEQQSPYAELRRLAEQLNLPELVDVADVMQLDETGAALSGTLRARVKELRDAHLTAEQIAASAAAEGMTLYMSLPALIFGLMFITPALLTIVLG